MQQPDRCDGASRSSGDEHFEKSKEAKAGIGEDRYSIADEIDETSEEDEAQSCR